MKTFLKFSLLLLFILFLSTSYGQSKDTLDIMENMVLVEGGVFQMGTEEKFLFHEELSTQEVSLDSFYIGKYEVTVGEYMDFVNATNSNRPEWLLEDKSFIQTKHKDDIMASLYLDIKDSLKNKNHPIVGVSWVNAIHYCNWLSHQNGFQAVYTVETDTVIANWYANGFRLPTEAEWEYAARSRGKKEIWAGTSNPSEAHLYSNFLYAPWFTEFKNDKYEKIAPIGSMLPNELGLYDMSGNVMEWCWDYANVNYYDTDNLKTNPKGPQRPFSGDSSSLYLFAGDRIVRGGTYAVHPYRSSCYLRGGTSHSEKLWSLGFRIAKNTY